MARMRKPKVPEHAPPILTNAELAAILRACDGPCFDDRRDAALVRVANPDIAQVLRRRGRAAGVDLLHPHLFRHTYAQEALSAGMQEGEVMALAGWRSREMLSRYAKSAERERAIAAACRVNVGDRL
jgi:integrase